MTLTLLKKHRAAETAQRLLASFVGMVDHPDADLVIAAEQTREYGRDYKAPHAYRGTPPRPHISRRLRFASAYDNDGRVIATRKPRLFKGHRP
jgi:hypothetical protein